MLSDTSRLENYEYQAYAVLTMCRILYMFENGTIVSKKEAAEWVEKRLCIRWSKLIEQASLWKKKQPFNNINKTMELIEFTIEFTNTSIENKTLHQ